MTVRSGSVRRAAATRVTVVLGLVLLATAGVAGSSVASDGQPEESETPGVVGVPPQTAEVGIAPVVELRGAVSPLVPRVAELLRRTGSVDGAVGHDEGAEQERYTLAGDVFFESDAAVLTDRARADLTTIAQALATAAPGEVTVVGHTDSVDDDAHNQALSLERATAVQQFLLTQAPGLTVVTDGRGEREPVAAEEGTPEQIAQARALNRRVEITATAGSAD